MGIGFDKQKYSILNGILFGNIPTYTGLYLFQGVGGGSLVGPPPFFTLFKEFSRQCQFTL